MVEVRLRGSTAESSPTLGDPSLRPCQPSGRGRSPRRGVGSQLSPVERNECSSLA